MGIHLFVMRSWYFLAVAMIGTLHITIPLAIATYYATRDREPLTMLMFVPVFFAAIAYLNVNAMRAVIRSYGLTGEPSFVNMVKAVARHVVLDTMFPVVISLMLAGAVAFGIFMLAGPVTLVGGFVDISEIEELQSAIGMLQASLNIGPSILINLFTVQLYIYPVILCVFGVSIASGAAGGSENPPGHLPIHGLGKKFWHIVATLLVNGFLVAAIAGTATAGAVWGVLNQIDILPSIGFGIMGLVLVLGYVNIYVVFALAYCAYEEERRSVLATISELRRYGTAEEAVDLRALRQSRMGGSIHPAE